MAMEYSTGQFHAIDTWNQPVESLLPVWTSIITLRKKNDEKKNIAFKNNLALE